MEFNLEPLRTTVLANMEAGQLIKRHLSDFATIDASLLNNAPFNNYVKNLTSKSELYEKGLAQVRKSDETEKIVLADDSRDKAIDAFAKALKLYAVSDVDAEVDASKSLSTLFASYKNIATISYEAESLAIDKLASELKGASYAPKIALLQMDRYVTRLENTNATFKTLFGSRMVTSAVTEVYDMKKIRKEMLAQYADFCDYVLAMCKATNAPLFPAALNLLNTARKYYADQLARHTATKTEKEKNSD